MLADALLGTDDTHQVDFRATYVAARALSSSAAIMKRPIVHDRSVPGGNRYDIHSRTAS
jgi:hypothetical protein